MLHAPDFMLAEGLAAAASENAARDQRDRVLGRGDRLAAEQHARARRAQDAPLMYVDAAFVKKHRVRLLNVTLAPSCLTRGRALHGALLDGLVGYDAVLVNQLLTGIWLTMSYTPSAEEAFVFRDLVQAASAE